MTQLIDQVISGGGVCRTAPATQKNVQLNFCFCIILSAITVLRCFDGLVKTRALCSNKVYPFLICISQKFVISAGL